MKILLLLLSITLLASACSTDTPIEMNYKEVLDYHRNELQKEDEKQQAKDKVKQQWCKDNASDKYAQQLCKEIK